MTREWLPLIGLTMAAFIFNTSEFIPIGLLSQISESFRITDALAGQIISVYSWVVALCSLPLILLLARVDCRKLFLWIMLLFALFNAFSGMSNSFSVLLCTRVGVALAHSLFWAIFIPMAARIAPEGKKSAGIGMVMSGTAVAMIVGVPIGRTIGLLWGWRVTFLLMAAFAAAVYVLLFIILPDVKSSVSISLRDLPKLLKKKSLVSVYVLTLIVITGNYTGYSFIEPFLAHIAGLDENVITLTLSAFGLSGVLGSWLFAKYFDNNPHRFTVASVGGLTLMLLVSCLAAIHPVAMIALCVIWGLSFTAYDLVCSADVVRLAPEADTIAMALYSGIFNAGIALGTMLGGVSLTHVSLAMTVPIGGCIALIGLVFYVKKAIKFI